MPTIVPDLYLSDTAILRCWTWDKDYYINRGMHVAQRQIGVVSCDRVTCMHGELQSFKKADNRLVLHIRDR